MERHDLGPPRLAAMGVHDGVAEAALWSGQGLFHDQAPVLEWSVDGQSIGTGFGVTVPAGETLSLRVQIEGGQAIEGSVGIVDLDADLEIARAHTEPTEDLGLEERRGWTAAEGDGLISADEGLRLAVEGADPDRGEKVRWMSAMGAGTILELDPQTADWLPEEVAFDDDGEVSDRSGLDGGRHHLLVLLIDGAGGNRWVWEDVGVDLSGTWLRHGGRLVPAPDEGVPTGLVRVRLAANSALDGLDLLDPTWVPSADAVPGPDCAPANPFSLDWVAQGRCVRDDLDGVEIVLAVQ